MKTYTPEETAAYIAARNQKRTDDRTAKKNRAICIVPHNQTFRGSIRTQFTGPNRNNIV